MIRTTLIAAGSALSATAFAQGTAPLAATGPRINSQAPAASTAKPTAAKWRASKLIGVDVFNEHNERLGDINEILLDRSGKVAGVVIGVGGFLGVGEHNIMVDLDRLKFVDKPLQAAASGTARTTTGTTASHATGDSWYPDHAVLDANKDRRASPAFINSPSSVHIFANKRAAAPVRSCDGSVQTLYEAPVLLSKLGVWSPTSSSADLRADLAELEGPCSRE
jgi:hypothetical protein